MNFQQYTESLGSVCFLQHHGSRPACYCTSVPLVNVLNTPERFHKAIELAALESQRGLLLLSITKRDLHHKMWLEELKEYEHTIIETKSRHHGNYKCWFVCIPME